MNLVHPLLLLLLIPLAVFAEEKQEEEPVLYGYKNGEITQGIGYGHYLHPMYFKGAANKYYKCAVEDEWSPMVSAEKPQKTGAPPKKYHQEQEDKKPFKYYEYPGMIPKKRLKPYSLGPRRSERIVSVDPHFRAEHVKFLQDINGLSDSRLIVDHKAEPYQDVAAMESENEANLNSVDGVPEDFIRQGYRVEENLENDIPPMGHKRRKKLPFETYKKFKIITVRPASVSTVKFNYPRPPQEYSRDLIPPPPPGTSYSYSYPYPYESPQSQYQSAPVMRPTKPPSKSMGLTLFEQFLLLFPRLIS